MFLNLLKKITFAVVNSEVNISDQYGKK